MKIYDDEFNLITLPDNIIEYNILTSSTATIGDQNNICVFNLPQYVDEKHLKVDGKIMNVERIGDQ
jgi:hypothetical protein